MSDPPPKSSHKTTPLAQDHENQENANAQESPPAYTPPPPPEYKKTPSSSRGCLKKIPYAPPTTTVVFVPMDFHSKPTEVMCPNCNVPITTRVEHEASALTWWLCCFVSIFVLFCNFTKDVKHFCPICQLQLGIYRRPCSLRIVMFVVLVVGILIILKIMLAMGDSRRYYG